MKKFKKILSAQIVKSYSKALTNTLRADYDSLPKEVKEKISYGDYCNDPNIKTIIQTAKNIAIGRMAVAIQRKKGNFRN
tara:strand:- start:41 stop:277 length:237 start_codon:yes stop_codon:yes gene_type:complete